MEVEWDPAKSEECYQHRGFDFAFAARVFLDPQRDVRVDHRFDYGEIRYQVFGHIDGRLFVVSYTIRSGRVRIISARKANNREVRRHANGEG